MSAPAARLRVMRKPEIEWGRYRSARPSAVRRPPFGFSHARTALQWGLRALGLEAGQTVLCPDFVCDTLADALEGAGLQVRFHPVGSRLIPDWGALEAVPGVAARALVMVHYFGVPQDAARYRALCDRKGWLLIEDNAHGQGGALDGRALGTLGDVGISSPRKSFPIRNGGLLYLRPGVSLDPPALPCQPLRLPVRLARSLVRRALDRAPALRARLQKCPPYASQAAFRGEIVRPWAMDEWSYEHVMQADPAALQRVRQRLYETWRAWTSGHGLVPVFKELAPGSAPLAYPAYSASPAQSQGWFAWGHRHGIDVHSWPTLPLSLVRDDGEAMRRWSLTVCFPLHQEVDPDDLLTLLKRLDPPR